MLLQQVAKLTRLLGRGHLGTCAVGRTLQLHTTAQEQAQQIAVQAPAAGVAAAEVTRPVSVEVKRMNMCSAVNDALHTALAINSKQVPGREDQGAQTLLVLLDLASPQGALPACCSAWHLGLWSTVYSLRQLSRLHFDEEVGACAPRPTCLQPRAMQAMQGMREPCLPHLFSFHSCN